MPRARKAVAKQPSPKKTRRTSVIAKRTAGPKSATAKWVGPKRSHVKKAVPKRTRKVAAKRTAVKKVSRKRIKVDGLSKFQRFRRKQAHEGMKLLRIWVPDPGAPGFAEEAKRQGELLRGRPEEQEALDFIEAAFEWPA